MKIFKKLVISFLIDSLIIGTILVAVNKMLDFCGWNFGNWDILLLLGMLLVKDLVFRNASIGKKIMGIAIYDENWQVPKIKTMLKHSLIMPFAGFALASKAKFIDGNLIQVFDFERDRIGTQVIDKKIYRKLQEEAKTMSGDCADNMTRLYNAYLRDIYLKE